jgi:D-cysteine desulfhydrase family pyridoxal phosphate-dependent enzyme
MSSTEDLFRRLSSFPRVPLAHLPTPLERVGPLSPELAPVNLFIKRDDQTGLAFGGNKTRKLEFIFGDVAEQGADAVVTWAGVQSNWCRQVAAAAARTGKKAVLVLLKKPDVAVGNDGNVLLDRILGADVRIAVTKGGENFLELENVRDFVDPVVEEVRDLGGTPYLAPVGGSLMEGSMTRPLGALGYVRAFGEILEQSRAMGFTPDTVILATGSAGTQAGLLAGARLLSPGTRVVGISVAAPAEDVSGYVRRIADATLEELGEEARVGEGDVVVLDDYIGEGYGILYPGVNRAVALMARREGILLDPVYTGKAVAGLLDLASKDTFREGDNVILLHTGGTPALFPYKGEILDTGEET